ncbi:Hypothetical predicted protein, partial [Paramuricea clavata]
FGSVCRPPFFNSVAQHSDECLRCFCNGRTTSCRSAQLYNSKLTSQWDCYSCTEKDEPRLVDRYGKSVNIYQISTVTRLYWQLPTRYSGNKVTSYGGNLTFTLDSNLIPQRSKRNLDQKKNYKPTVWNYVKETPNNRSWFGDSKTSRTLNDVPSGRKNNPGSNRGTASGPRVLNLTEGHSVFIVGSDGTQLGSTDLDYLDDGGVGIRITEENWKETLEKSRRTSRSTLLRVLADVKFIFVKGTSSADIL